MPLYATYPEDYPLAVVQAHVIAEFRGATARGLSLPVIPQLALPQSLPRARLLRLLRQTLYAAQHRVVRGEHGLLGHEALAVRRPHHRAVDRREAGEQPVHVDGVPGRGRHVDTPGCRLPVATVGRLV